MSRYKNINPLIAALPTDAMILTYSFIVLPMILFIDSNIRHLPPHLSFSSLYQKIITLSRWQLGLEIVRVTNLNTSYCCSVNNSTVFTFTTCWLFGDHVFSVTRAIFSFLFFRQALKFIFNVLFKHSQWLINQNVAVWGERNWAPHNTPSRCSKLKGVRRESMSARAVNYAIKYYGISEAAFIFLWHTFHCFFLCHI